MKKLRLKFKYLPILLLSAGMFSLTNPQTVQADKETTVVVGYTHLDNFEEGAKKGAHKSGYGYDYLQEVAQYAGWKYKYVYGSWNHIYKLLKAGKIDMMADIAYTHNNDKQFGFPYMQMDDNIYHLYVARGNAGKYINAADFNNVKVGVVANTAGVNILRLWSDKQHVKLQVKQYQSFNELHSAFKSGKVKAIVENDTRISDTSTLVPTTIIGSTNVYLAVAKKRPDLLYQLNNAQSKMMSSDPYIRTNLAKKYYYNSPAKNMMSSTEWAWAKKHRVLDVGYLKENVPYSYKSDGRVSGLYVDFLNSLRKDYKLNFEYRYHAYQNYPEMVKALKKGTIDMAVPFNDFYSQSESLDVSQTSSLAQVEMVLLTRKNYQLSKKSTFAVVKGGAVKRFYTRSLYPACKTKSYPTIRDALMAVKNKEADAIILDNYQVQANNDASDGLKASNLNQEAGYTIGINKDNLPLLSLVNRAITGYSGFRAASSLLGHTEQNRNFSLRATIYHYRWQIGMAVIGALGCIGVLSVYAYQKQRAQKLTEWMMNHDSLTDVLSRNAYDKLVDSYAHKKAPKNLCVGLFDANGLKEVNDIKGHSAGDNLLKGIATCLTKAFGKDKKNKIYRIGGDEFVVFAETSHDNFVKMQDDFREELEQNKLSTSVGYVEQREYPKSTLAELIGYADEKMYHDKYVSKGPLDEKISYSQVLKSENRDDKNILEGVSALAEMTVDSFTGLPTMSYFLSDSSKSRARMLKNGDLPVTICFELNKFDNMEYTYGVRRGDEALAVFAGILAQYFGKDNCCRLAKARFFVRTSNVNLEKRINKVFKQLEGSKLIDKVTVRAGIYVYNPEKPTKISAECDYAAIACQYFNKQNGSQYTYFDYKMIGE